MAMFRRRWNGRQWTRNFDGEDETEEDQRFFALREMGYRGPIDQDGYAASIDDPDRDIFDSMARQRGEEPDDRVAQLEGLPPWAFRPETDAGEDDGWDPCDRGTWS